MMKKSTAFLNDAEEFNTRLDDWVRKIDNLQ
jgi:hypothetical protein